MVKLTDIAGKGDINNTQGVNERDLEGEKQKRACKHSGRDFDLWGPRDHEHDEVCPIV